MPLPYVDADTHIVEAEDVWQYLTPEERRFKPLRVVTDDSDGRQFWLVGNQYLPGGNRTNLAQTLGGVEPEVRDLTNLAKRIEWQDRLGHDIQVVYPTVFLQAILKRPEVELALTRSYNRHLSELCNQSKGRLRFAIVPPLSDIPAAIQEIEHGREHGGCAVLFRALEQDRPLTDPYFFPIYDAAQELDIPIAIHVGNSKSVPPVIPLGGAPLLQTVPVIATLYQLLISDVPERFPRLRFAFLEASASWLPFVLHRAGRHLQRGVAQPKLDPDILEQKRFYVACMSDEDLPYVISKVGDRCLIIGSDFGHSDIGTDLYAHKLLDERTDLSETSKHRILNENARRLYGL